MRLATVAEIKNQLSRYLARARKRREPIIVTHHGKPYALIQPISERDLETLDWRRLADEQLRRAWAEEDDALYDYDRHSDCRQTKGASLPISWRSRGTDP